jgi:hypothetical protein
MALVLSGHVSNVTVEAKAGKKLYYGNGKWFGSFHQML